VEEEFFLYLSSVGWTQESSGADETSASLANKLKKSPSRFISSAFISSTNLSPWCPSCAVEENQPLFAAAGSSPW
jgi:hypothetical protein